MHRSIALAAFVQAFVLLASLQSAQAGLGESESPQRLRCENHASEKFAMWQWFARRDFVERCLTAQGVKTGKSRKRS